MTLGGTIVKNAAGMTFDGLGIGDKTGAVLIKGGPGANFAPLTTPFCT